MTTRKQVEGVLRLITPPGRKWILNVWNPGDGHNRYQVAERGESGGEYHPLGESCYSAGELWDILYCIKEYIRETRGGASMITKAEVERGKLLARPIPPGAMVIGIIRRGDDQGEEVLVRLQSGKHVAMNAGVIRTAPPTEAECVSAFRGDRRLTTSLFEEPCNSCEFRTCDGAEGVCREEELQ